MPCSPSISFRCAALTASILAGFAMFATPAAGCDPDHIESITITNPINIAQGGTATARVTVTCIVTGSDLQSGGYLFDTRLVDADSVSDTTLGTHTYRAPGPKTEVERARAVYSFTVTLSCPNETVKAGSVDTGEGAPNATPCTDPANLWIEIDEGSDSESANYGNGHTTTRWPGDTVSTGSSADACCVPLQTSALTSTVLDEVSHAFLLRASDEMVLCDDTLAAVGEENPEQLVSRRCGPRQRGPGRGRRSELERERFDLEAAMAMLLDDEATVAELRAVVREIRGYTDLGDRTLWQEFILFTVAVEVAPLAPLLGEEGVEQTAEAATIHFTGPTPFVAVDGPINPDGTFLATGRGDFLFLQDIAVQFEGRVVGGRLRGTYTIGPENTLPMNMQLDFDVSVSFDGWDGFWGRLSETLIEAGQEFSKLSLPAPIGGVDVSEFTQNIGGHLILAGHGLSATLDDDETPVLPAAPGVDGLEAARMELERWADAAAASAAPNASELAAHLRTMAGLFGEASSIRAEINTQRMARPTENLVVSIDDLLFTLDKASDSIAQLSALLFGSRFTTVSAADFMGPATAAEAIVSGFGAELAGGLEVATQIPLPTELSGTSVRVTDSRGDARLASLFFGSGGQFNYQIPRGTAPGIALVTVFSGSRVVATGRVFVQAAAPSVFAANADGAGVAAAVVLRIAADGSRTTENVFSSAAAGSRVAVPVAFGPAGERLFLLLFGTGIRGGQQIQVLVDGVEVPVLGFAASGEFVGLDQVNVELLAELAGRGEVEIELIVDGISANKITMNFG